METRRSFLKKVAYTTPLILTVAVRPALAAKTYGGPNGKPSTDGPGSPPRAASGSGDSHPWWAVWRNW